MRWAGGYDGNASRGISPDLTRVDAHAPPLDIHMADKPFLKRRWVAITGTIILTVVGVLIIRNFATPEKKLSLVVPHAHAVREPQFKREMGLLLGPSVLPGNRITALNDGDEIFPAMLGAIASAQRTITFETYIYWSGEVGNQFTQALIERAQAGVKVHVTVDWLGSVKMDNALIEQMRQAGVQVERYRPINWYNLDRVNNRTHRKLLVVDGRTGFTGGVGIADQWSGRGQDPDHWRDSHFMIEGPAVGQIQAAFNDNWIKTTGTTLTGEDYFPALESVGDSDAQLFLASPQGGSESMHLFYLMAIAASVERIDLAASYFVPDRLLIHALLEARRRGVAIRILVPGEHIDSDTVRLSSRSDWGPLLAAGIEIAEYQPTMLHVKMLIIDRELVSVGSTNFDIRSFRLNDEASLNVYDHDFAADMTGVFDRDWSKGKVYTFERWENRPLKEKVMETLIKPIKSQL